MLPPSQFSCVSCGVDRSWADQNSWGIPARSRQEARLNPGNNARFSVCLLAFPWELAAAGMVPDAAFLGAGLRRTDFYLPKGPCVCFITF